MMYLFLTLSFLLHAYTLHRIQMLDRRSSEGAYDLDSYHEYWKQGPTHNHD
ncbi:hypothetical protein LCGC14_0357040 [marine sediment metagenome]|uniref:Uncharacterized protein n=1 Tax=marine sediment metagenome TaxID=412755 RepID=A0A0F9T934_9ZZZZ